LVENISQTVDIFKYIESIVKRIDDMQKLTVCRFEEQMKIHIDSIKQNAEKESDRINELRKGDIEVVSVANKQAIKTAELLAAQMLENAEVLRKSVELTASAIASQLQQITQQQDARFIALEKASWENASKAGDISALILKVAELDTIKNENKGKAGISTPLMIGITVAISSALTGLIVVGIQSIIK